VTEIKKKNSSSLLIPTINIFMF